MRSPQASSPPLLPLPSLIPTPTLSSSRMGELWSGGGVNNPGIPTQPGRTPRPPHLPASPAGQCAGPRGCSGACYNRWGYCSLGPRPAHRKPGPRAPARLPHPVRASPSSALSPSSVRRSTRCCALTSPVGAPAPGVPSASCSTAPRSASAAGQLRPQPQGPAKRPPRAGPLPAMGPGEQEVGAVWDLQGRSGSSLTHSWDVRNPSGEPLHPTQLFWLQTQEETSAQR